MVISNYRLLFSNTKGNTKIQPNKKTNSLRRTQLMNSHNTECPRYNKHYNKAHSVKQSANYKTKKQKEVKIYSNRGLRCWEPTVLKCGYNSANCKSEKTVVTCSRLTCRSWAFKLNSQLRMTVIPWGWQIYRNQLTKALVNNDMKINSVSNPF